MTTEQARKAVSVLTPSSHGPDPCRHDRMGATRLVPARAPTWPLLPVGLVPTSVVDGARPGLVRWAEPPYGGFGHRSQPGHDPADPRVTLTRCRVLGSWKHRHRAPSVEPVSVSYLLGWCEKCGSRPGPSATSTLMIWRFSARMGAMSSSAAHSAAFYSEVVREGAVWGVRDDGGFLRL